MLDGLIEILKTAKKDEIALKKVKKNFAAHTHLSSAILNASPKSVDILVLCAKKGFTQTLQFLFEEKKLNCNILYIHRGGSLLLAQPKL